MPREMSASATQSRVTRVLHTQAGCTDEGFVLPCRRDADLLGFLDQAPHIRKGRNAVAGASLTLIFKSLIVTAQKCAQSSRPAPSLLPEALWTPVRCTPLPGLRLLPHCSAHPGRELAGRPGEKRGGWRAHPRVGVLPFRGAGRSRGRTPSPATWDGPRRALPEPLLGAGREYWRPGRATAITGQLSQPSVPQGDGGPGPGSDATPGTPDSPGRAVAAAAALAALRCAAHRSAGRATAEEQQDGAGERLPVGYGAAENFRGERVRQLGEDRLGRVRAGVQGATPPLEDLARHQVFAQPPCGWEVRGDGDRRAEGGRERAGGRSGSCRRSGPLHPAVAPRLPGGAYAGLTERSPPQPCSAPRSLGIFEIIIILFMLFSGGFFLVFSFFLGSACIRHANVGSCT